MSGKPKWPGFYFISSWRKLLEARRYVCPLVVNEPKKKKWSKLFAKCLPRDKFSWNHNKPLYIALHSKLAQAAHIDLLKITLCFLWVRRAIYSPRTLYQTTAVSLWAFHFSSDVDGFHSKLASLWGVVSFFDSHYSTNFNNILTAECTSTPGNIPYPRHG